LVFGIEKVSDRIIKGTANSALGQEQAGEERKQRKGKGKKLDRSGATEDRERK